MANKEFDKYWYYSKAVQSPDVDVIFFRKTFKKLKKRKPVSLREDFCGTFAISCEWVKLDRTHEAIGVDLDQEPIEYGKAHYLPELNANQQQRLKILNANVLDPKLPKVDLIAASNFSYFIFKTRKQLRAYLENCLHTLNEGGVLIMDCFGGSQCYEPIEDENPKDGFMYYWHQKSFDPITNEAFFAIHFKPEGRRKIKDVFTYDWRMWSIPELRELLAEVGFKKTQVYWEGTEKDGSGDGVYSPAEKGEHCASWVAYVSAEK